MNNSKGWVRPAVVVILFGMPGCAPSQDTIKIAVSSNLKQGIPASLIPGGSMFTVGSNAQIEEIKIVSVGKAQDNSLLGKGYPVKVRVRGTCTVASLAGSGKRKFDGERDFFLSKNSQGNWVAQASTLW